MKTAVIYFAENLNGRMSAAIVKHWVETKKCDILHDTLYFIEYNYGQPIPDLSEYNMVVMVGVFYQKEEMDMLYEKLKDNFIWIDNSYKAIKENNQDIKGVRNPIFSTCELAWLYFMTEQNKLHFDEEDVNSMPEIIKLTGEFDSFTYGRKKGLCRRTMYFSSVANILIKNKDDAYQYLLKSIEKYPIPIETLFIQEGCEDIFNRCNESRKAVQDCFKEKITRNKFDVYLCAYKFTCVNIDEYTWINLNLFERLSQPKAYCYFDGKMFQFHIFSNNKDVNCNTIAQYYGGEGSHTSATFQCNVETFAKLLS